MNLNQILRYSLITGIFLFPFIPFLVPSSMFFPFITGKNLAFRILVEILLGIYVALAVRDASYRPRFSWLLGVFVLFLAVIGLADFLSENPFKSFWSNYERMEGYVTFLHLFAYFVLLSSVFKTEKLWERFFQTSIFASAIMAIVGVFQYAGVLQIHQGANRLDAALGNATYLAIYVVLNIFIALFLFSRHKNLGLRIFYGLSILLNLFVLYETETRGAILGLLGGLFLASLIVAIFERDNKRFRKFAISGVVGLLVVAGIFFAVRETSFVQSQPTLKRLASISITDPSSNARFYIWAVAYQGFKERPILGWGQESFNYVFNKYYDPKLYAQEQWFDRTHNVILDWLIAGGLLGLLGYLSLYLIALFYVWKKGEFTFAERAVFTGMLAAYFFHNLFVFDNIVSLIIFVSFLGYLHAHAVRPSAPRGGETPTWLSVSIVPTAMVLSFVLVYVATASAYQANVTLIKAISSTSAPEQALGFYKQALAYNSLGNQEIREQLMQYVINLRSAQNVSDTVKQDAFNLITSEMQKMIAEAPSDTRHHLFFGTVLDAYGQSPQAESELLLALKTSPKKQSIIFQLGTHYLNVGDTTKALATFKEAYDLAPAYQEAKLIYSMGAIYAGNIALSDQILEGIVPTDDRFLRAYIAAKQYDRAIAVAKAKIAQNPTDGNSVLNLAAVYYQAGRKNEAIDVINQIIASNPGFKSQGEELIRQIQTGTVQ